MIMLLILVLGAAALFARDLASRSSARAHMRETTAALATGRILTTLASSAGVLLLGLLLRHRGLLAVIAGCGILAVYPDSVSTARTILVEPWLVLFCLLGALALFDGSRLTSSRKRLLWGGVAFGFAGFCGFGADLGGFDGFGGFDGRRRRVKFQFYVLDFVFHRRQVFFELGGQDHAAFEFGESLVEIGVGGFEPSGDAFQLF